MRQGVHFRNTCQDFAKNRTKALWLCGALLAHHTAIWLLSQASFPTRAEGSRLLPTEGTPQAGEKDSASTQAPSLKFTHNGDLGESRVRLTCRSPAQNHKPPACPLSRLWSAQGPQGSANNKTGCVATAWITEQAFLWKTIGFPNTKGTSLETENPAPPLSVLQWQLKLLNSSKAIEMQACAEYRLLGVKKKKELGN